MINTNNIRVFNFIKYTILACIFPVAYFAPIGSWLLISILALSLVIKFLLNGSKIKLDNFYIPLIAIFLILISYFYSINPDKSLNAMSSAIGMIIAIYIVLNTSSRSIIKNFDNIIGIPIFLTSLCIFLDLVFNTEIRSSLALLVGDKPTSESGNYSRGIIILTMIMPISVALFINNKKYIFAFIILILISLVVMLGPNESAKMALILSYLTTLIIYFLGPKSFFYFGAISLLWIIFCPFLAIKVIPIIKNVNYEIDTKYTCEAVIESANFYKLPYQYTDDSEIVIKNQNVYQTYKVLKDGNCLKIQPWQDTSVGGSIIHRLLVWEYVGKTILNKLIIGHGIGTSRLIGQNIILNVPPKNLTIKGGIPLHPHNNFLEIWLELGLLGTLIISLIWIKIIKFGITIRKNSYILGTGVCTSIITTFVISNLTFGMFQAWWMASLGLFFLLIVITSKQKNNNGKVI
ncbi:O-antigen ligase family protein [Alphaproteobacteria bacterium]|nr:O-antigen ligase family protein [Alphaproteobacteria bacterium]